MTGAQFLKRLRRRIVTDPQETGGWPEAPLAYDAVWALALMLNCTMDNLINGKGLQQFNYNNTNIAKRMFECMKDIQFRGVSGQVMFSDLGDRIARTQIEQMQNGKYILLGYYDSSTQTLEWKNKEKFIGSKGPPSDSTRIKQWPIGVDYRLYLVCINIMVIAIVFCISIFIFNQRYSHRRPIIQSQRQCNNLLIAGSVLSLFSLAPIGFPQDGNNDDSIGQIATLGGENKIYSTYPFLFSTSCHTKLLLLMLGFSLAYGSLFAKVWVAHKLGSIQKSRQMTAANNNNNNNNEESSDGCNIQLTNNSQQIPPTPWDSIRTLLTAITNRQAIVANALEKYLNILMEIYLQQVLEPIPPSNFYPIIGIICLIDLLISLIWFLFDPMQQQQIHFPLQEPPIGTDLDIMLLPVLDLCQSQYHDIWTAILLSYKGLLLLLGLFLAYDTKHLKIRYLNDLNSTLLSICNVGVLCLLCGTIVVFFLRTQPNPFFCFISITVYVCTFVSIGLIFGPKLLYIYRNPHSTKKEEEEEQQYKKQNTFHESSINQAEQNKYQQLLKENIELKRQIETRNIRIQECRRILENQLVLSSPRVKTNRKCIPQNNTNNNNTAAISSSITVEYTISSCLPTTSSGVGGMGGNGGILLELEQTTISSVMEPTMITILDQQQELSTIEMEQSCDITDNQEEELPLIEDERREERSPIVGGVDTGVCSDYDEDEDNYLNKRKQEYSNESLNNKESEDEEEEEEILL
uniref:G_PROTEIN_RECEP_F3_4 domain-containing protein n=2 Tax=Meloidogyne hapla TaxID=6305 RepID=A0A1I8B028_MELHA